MAHLGGSRRLMLGLGSSLACFAALLALVDVPDAGVWPFAHLALHVGAAVTVLSRYRQDRYAGWLVLGAFAVVWAVGLAGWVWDLSYPDAPEVAKGLQLGSLALAPVGIVGLGMVAFRGSHWVHPWRVASDWLVIGAAVVAVLWGVGIRPAVPIGSGNEAGALVGAISPAVDGLAIAVLLTGFVYQRRRTTLLWLGVGLGFTSIGDFVLAYRLAAGNPEDPSGIVAVCWVLASVAFLVGVSARDDVSADPSPTSPRREVMYGLAGMAALVFAWLIVDGDGLDSASAWLGYGLSLAMLVNHTLLFRETTTLMGSNAQSMSVLRDVSSQLEHLAGHDPLTGLPNRAYFMTHLEAALACFATGERELVAVLLLDIDRFKLVNDSLGHEAGDELLRATARRLAEHTTTATVARFSGDEFTILPGPEVCTDEQLSDLVEELMVVVRMPVELSDGEVTYPTASIGVSLARAGAEGITLVSDADAAMYRAKELGRNRYEHFEESSRNLVRTRHRLVSELHRAIEHDELVVHYQPVVELVSGRVSGFEALVRWEHPERGLLSPAHFVDLAEESGLIVGVGEVVLRKACHQVAEWQRQDILGPRRPIEMSVNLAARQVTDPSFPETLADVLATTGVDPDLLWFELTETALMADVRAASATLAAIRELGAHVTVDDFGTGYSSLTYLKRFPVEGLKIDRSFVDGLGVDAEDTAIVETVLGLARSLQLKVVAEGIETPVQLQRLRRLRCAAGQGFLFSRPVPADEIIHSVRDSHAASGADPAVPDSALPSPPSGLDIGREKATHA